MRGRENTKRERAKFLITPLHPLEIKKGGTELHFVSLSSSSPSSRFTSSLLRSRKKEEHTWAHMSATKDRTQSQWQGEIQYTSLIRYNPLRL